MTFYLDDFLLFFFYMVEWSLGNKTLRFLLIIPAEIIFQSLNHVEVNLKPQFLIKSSYYIVPSSPTILIDILRSILISTQMKINLGQIKAKYKFHDKHKIQISYILYSWKHVMNML